MFALTLLLTVLFSGMLTAFLAGQRGYNPVKWYLLGVVLGPLGFLVRFLPRRSHAPMSLFA
jgi:hypothetical protein